MNIQITLAVLAVIGALVYWRAANPKAAELGRWVFVCAFLAICLGQANHIVPWYR